jgi:hypothetical protein
MQALNSPALRARNTSFEPLQQANTIAGTESPRRYQTDLEIIRMHGPHQQDNALTIEVPSIFGKRTIVFTQEYVAEDKRKIYYKDVTKISYSALMHSINFVPGLQQYKFMVGSADQKIDVNIATTLYIGNAARKDIWQKLVGIALNVIQPRIVEKLTRRIFVDGEAARIDDIEFTREGYSRGKLFGGREQILWADASFVPTLDAGNVFIWGDKNSNPKVHFYKISVDEPNAVVVPELMKACVKAAAIGYVPMSL